MEVIRIPQVSLVDASGRRIGVYSDDPDWWQQLKLKHQNQQMPPPALTQHGENEALPTTSHTSLRSNFNSQTNLIKSIKDVESGHASGVSNMLPDEHQQECNMVGETPLHIAIMYDDLSTIKYLIETKDFDVNQRCVSGKFVGGFNNKTTSNLIQQSKYEGLAYYGEYPLAFAACFASKEIYDYLIEKGADPNLQDTNGNTVLHVLVINNLLDMFQYATNHPMKKALLTVKNNQDLTPINLAAKLGRKAIFDKMLELQTIEFWRYSNITCSAYPLEGLDTVDADGKIAPNAALSYVVNGSTDDHLDMLEIGVVKRLLEDKWSTYAQRRLYQKLAISAIHLIFLSVAVYTRAPDTNYLLRQPENANTYIRYIAEAGVVLGCLATMFQAAQEIYAQGLLYYLKNLSAEPANVFYVIFGVLILAAVPFRFIAFSNAEKTMTNKHVEDTLVIIAIPCGWVHLLFYARVASVTGPFVVMIYKMIAGDILTFASIYILLLFGFSLGFYYLYKNAAEDITAMGTYPEALMLSFQMTLGEFKARLPEFDELYYSEFTKIVFVAFMILMHILLLNMLIAMMGNTYHQIIKKSEKEWRKQWAQVVIMLERSFSPQDLKKFQNQYCIKLPSKDENNKNELGLMVIKKVAKTKAYQKTTCKRNWKRFYKSVSNLLKTNHFNSAKLLEMWACKDQKPLKARKKGDQHDLSWNTMSLNNLKSIAGNSSKKGSENKNNKPNNKKPPAVEQIKVKTTQETKNETKSEKNDAVKSQAPQPPKNSGPSAAVKQPLGKSESEPTPNQGSTASSSNSRPHSDSDDQKAFNTFNRTTANKIAFGKAFKPNPTPKIYNAGNEAPKENIELVNPRQVTISPQRELSKPDLKDIKRPPTSTNRFSYNNTMSDNSSLNSESTKSPDNQP